MRKSNYQAPMEKWLVGSGNQALRATGTLNGAGTALNLTNGQFGAISTDHRGTVANGTYIPAGTTGVQVESIKIVQGTPNSTNVQLASPFKVNDQAYIDTHNLVAGKIETVATTKFRVPSYSSFLIKSLAGLAVDTRYTANITLESVRGDIVYGMNRESTSATVTTPAVAPTNINDYVLQNLALDLNRGSATVSQNQPNLFTGNKPYVVFGVNIGGATGTVIGTLAAGTTFNFATYTVGGSSYTATFTTNTTFISSLTKAIAADASLATARIVTLGSVAPGTAATINALLFVALDDPEALAFDDIMEFKNRLQSVGIAGGAVTYSGAVTSPPFEGSNTGRQVFLRYMKRANMQVWNMQNHPVDAEYFITIPNYLNRSAAGYTVTEIVHKGYVNNLNNTSEHPMKAVIALPASITNPSANANTGYTVATDATTTVTDLNAIVGAWLSSVDDEYSNIEYKGDATKSTPFV